MCECLMWTHGEDTVSLSLYVSYFALLSLGSSPSDDEDGDGEGPDWLPV